MYKDICTGNKVMRISIFTNISAPIHKKHDCSNNISVVLKQQIHINKTTQEFIENIAKQLGYNC